MFFLEDSSVVENEMPFNVSPQLDIYFNWLNEEITSPSKTRQTSWKHSCSRRKKNGIEDPLRSRPFERQTLDIAVLNRFIRPGFAQVRGEIQEQKPEFAANSITGCVVDSDNVGHLVQPAVGLADRADNEQLHKAVDPVHRWEPDCAGASQYFQAEAPHQLQAWLDKAGWGDLWAWEKTLEDQRSCQETQSRHQNRQGGRPRLQGLRRQYPQCQPRRAKIEDRQKWVQWLCQREHVEVRGLGQQKQNKRKAKAHHHQWSWIEKYFPRLLCNLRQWGKKKIIEMEVIAPSQRTQSQRCAKWSRNRCSIC